MPPRSVFASALTFGATAQASAANPGIVAHKAFYEMQMGEKLQNSHIVSVNGRSVFAMERECSGWRSIEDYMIQFVAENGGADRVLSHFESWEADSGDKYSFDIMEESSLRGARILVVRPARSGQFGRSVLHHGARDSIDLPTDTLFPVQHVQRVLRLAESGEKMVAATVFTGAEPDSALMRTSTVVGGWRDEPAADLGPLAEDGYWQINIAYFASGENSRTRI